MAFDRDIPDDARYADDPRRTSSTGDTSRWSNQSPRRYSLQGLTASSSQRSLSPHSCRAQHRHSVAMGESMPIRSQFGSLHHANSLSRPGQVRRRSSIWRRQGFEDVPLNDLTQPRPATPPPAKRTLRTTARRLSDRFSLTPSELPWPSPAMFNPEEPYKAEQMLGLRPALPPPVPPKPAKYLNKPSPPPSYGSNKPLPEGPNEPLNGRTAWLHALTPIFVVANCWGQNLAFGLFEAYYTRYYLPNTSPSTIAWIGSTQLALVFGLGVPVGRIVDKGHFRLMFRGGSLLMLIGLFATSACTAFGSLWLVQGLLTGLGMGMVFCSGILALMSWFDESKMGIAMGLGAAGSCLGGIVYVLLARHYLPIKGFATTIRIIGGVATASMIPPNLVFRMRPSRRLPAPSTHRASTSRITWRTFLTPPSYVFAAFGLFLTFLGVYIAFVYIVLFGSTELHLSDTASTNLLIFMLLANLPGRFVPALISDKCIGPLNTITPAAFLSSAVVWLWAATSENATHAGLLVTACFYGFVSAGVQVLYAPTVYAFCLEPTKTSLAGGGQGTKLALHKMGVKAGGIFTCIGLACLIGTPIGGALVSYRTDRHMGQPFLGAQIFAGVCLMLGGVFLLLSRVAKVGWTAKRA